MSGDNDMPLFGSVATEYPNIRLAARPTREDIRWADLVLMVDPVTSKRSSRKKGSVPKFPSTPVLDRITDKAKKAGVTPESAVSAALAMVSSGNRLTELKALLVGPDELSRRVMLIAAEEVTETINLWMRRTPSRKRRADHASDT
ncbi:hypothetical protein NLB33_35245 [Mycolicibacterium smegmatis]|uniref:hypothetical protein n=1 Tax=Mycolicibacterium smegmatis TaxID=1772 RepID=UPI0020A29C5E|nr:hypothetical protein [Mycolicibacterium smegmatis]MCP2628108.1 hypothetical protein [Mycolicibacterium smegmatis]